jgi:hypothetical protein
VTADPDGPKGARTGLDDAASSLRADAADLDHLLHVLVERLGSVPGVALKIRFRRSRWRRMLGDIPYVNDLDRTSSPIERVEVALGARRYLLNVTGPSFTCCVEQTGAGAGAGATLGFSQWMQALTGDIGRQSDSIRDAVASLQQLLIYDRMP